jgi:ATP-dependent exoDNAse (exonuclease V) beta subunit
MRFANVRKLMRLASDFESAEGRDLRGLLDFLAARADADADAQAATAVEGHDGVRIMTIHSAKGLEFDVVAIPHLSRGLLPSTRTPLLTLGREQESPRVGMQLRRLGARGINLYAQRELCEEAQVREAEEELRLFHVGATRARQRLLLSGVISPTPQSRESHGKAVIERIAAAFEIDRERDSTIAIAAAEPRPGLDATFLPSEIAVHVNLASSEQAQALTVVRKEADGARDLGVGPAPLVAQRPGKVARRPLSYTALSAHGEGSGDQPLDSDRALRGQDGEEQAEASGAARGIGVHALLEWSQANEWQVPPLELIRRIAQSGEINDSELSEEALLGPFKAWLGSSFFAERIQSAEKSRAEVPLLIEVAGTVLRGSIDLLVEQEGQPPLIVDYKTDRVDGQQIAELVTRYEIQQTIYALAVAEARKVPEVELAYVFLERPEEPFIARWGSDEIEVGRAKLETQILSART